MPHLLVLTASFLFALSVSAADVEHAFQSVVARGGVQRVVIDIPFGSFKVRNGSAGQLALSGIVSRDYDGSKERIWAQKVVNDTTVEFHIDGANAVVRRRFGPKAQSWRARKFSDFDLTLDLPPGIDVRFETTAGEIDLVGTYGDIHVDLRAGEANLRVPRKVVRELNASCRIGEVRTNLGNEIVTREGVLPGSTHFFNAAGKSHVKVHVTAGEVNVALTD